jgi:hypothetical protein
MPEITIAIAMVIGLTQVIKKTRLLADRYTPLVALFLGVAVSSLVNKGFTPDIVFSGIIVGLSSMGMWSGTKNTIKK